MVRWKKKRKKRRHTIPNPNRNHNNKNKNNKKKTRKAQGEGDKIAAPNRKKQKQKTIKTSSQSRNYYDDATKWGGLSGLHKMLCTAHYATMRWCLLCCGCVLVIYADVVSAVEWKRKHHCREARAEETTKQSAGWGGGRVFWRLIGEEIPFGKRLNKRVSFGTLTGTSTARSSASISYISIGSVWVFLDTLRYLTNNICPFSVRCRCMIAYTYIYSVFCCCAALWYFIHSCCWLPLLMLL